jgi:phosphoenolpyruvate synthase/pyruvate phosphate dikinase
MTPSAATLTGLGASAGRATGRFFVARSLSELERFEAGEILVVRESNPAWITGFLVAAGVVAEFGGVISHAAIAARELGLPCVVGVPEATSLIRTGRTGSIDGATGAVEIDG